MKQIRERGVSSVGMGFVQITWEDHYERASLELCKKASAPMCVDFVGNPKLLLEPQYAAPNILLI